MYIYIYISTMCPTISPDFLAQRIQRYVGSQVRRPSCRRLPGREGSLDGLEVPKIPIYMDRYNVGPPSYKLVCNPI